MKKHIYAYEVSIRWRSVWVWSASLLTLLAVFMSLYPSFSAENEAMLQVLSDFPPEFKALFGLSELDLGSLVGYYAFCFVFCQLCLAIQASNYGFGLVSAEESQHTADFLLTKPISRSSIFWSKLFAAVTSLTVTNLVVWLGSFLLITFFKGKNSVDFGLILLLLGSIIIFQLLFFSFGGLISVVIGKIRSVTPWSLGLAFGLYLLNALGGVVKDVQLEYLSPFKHFDPAWIIEHGGCDWPIVLIDVGLIVLALLIALWLYQKRDIPTPA
ncbi:MAG: ABC transporter permease subunit [Anaerolineaceae bacterium]